jgi:hypothetical protein
LAGAVLVATSPRRPAQAVHPVPARRRNDSAAPLGRNEGDMSWFHRHDEYLAVESELLPGLLIAVEDE